MHYDGAKSFFERLEQSIAKKKKKLFKTAEQTPDEDESTFKPKINPKNKLNRSVNDLLTWKKKREDKRFQRGEEMISFLKGETKEQDSLSPHLKPKYRFNKPKTPFKKDIRPVSERLYKYDKYYRKRRDKKEQKKYESYFKPDTFMSKDYYQKLKKRSIAMRKYHGFDLEEDRPKKYNKYVKQKKNLREVKGKQITLKKKEKRKETQEARNNSKPAPYHELSP